MLSKLVFMVWMVFLVLYRKYHSESVIFSWSCLFILCFIFLSCLSCSVLSYLSQFRWYIKNNRVLKMSENTNSITLSNGEKVSFSPTVKKILKCCYVISQMGKPVSVANLKMTEPNHSNRDYASAFSIYNDLQERMDDPPVPLPEQVQGMFKGWINLMWSTVWRQGEERIATIKNEYQKALAESRSAYANVQSAVEQLESEVQQKQTDMETLQKKLEAVISSDREKELKIQELSAEAKKYRDMYDMLKVNFERLTTWHSNVETGNVKQQSEDRRVSEASVK